MYATVITSALHLSRGNHEDWDILRFVGSPTELDEDRGERPALDSPLSLLAVQNLFMSVKVSRTVRLLCFEFQASIGYRLLP